MATNSLPRWLISMTDMPASRQLTSSHLARSSTSTGIAAGPAPKLKMRAAGLMCCAVAAGAAAVLAISALSVAVLSVAVVAVAVLAVLVVAVHDRLQPRKLLALVEVDEDHALRRAAHLANLVHARADEDAARGDQHDLVLGRGERGGDDLAVPLRGLDRDHALRAAAVARVFGDRRALAVAILGRGEDALLLILRDEQRDDLAALREVHAAHAAGAPAHRAHVVLVEAHRLALVGKEHHVVLAVGHGH